MNANAGCVRYKVNPGGSGVKLYLHLHTVSKSGDQFWVVLGQPAHFIPDFPLVVLIPCSSFLNLKPSAACVCIRVQSLMLRNESKRGKFYFLCPIYWRCSCSLPHALSVTVCLCLCVCVCVCFNLCHPFPLLSAHSSTHSLKVDSSISSFGSPVRKKNRSASYMSSSGSLKTHWWLSSCVGVSISSRI